METTKNDASSSRKRQPSGACAECRTPILKSKRYCRVCADLVAERQRKAKEGYVVIGTSAGPVELLLPKLWISRTVVFDAGPMGRVPWTQKTPCGQVLDLVLRILRSEPPYVTERDARRHMALICHLKSYRATVWERGVQLTEVVEAQPLHRLERALESWVRSWFPEPNSLVSCYALDTANFILAHVFGVDEYSEGRIPWRINPLLPPELIDEVSRRNSFRDQPRFKSDLTGAIRNTLVIAKVPPRGRCMDRSGKEVIFGAGDEFIVELVRCHRSTSFYDWPAMTAIDEDEPEFSLSRDFEIPCEFRARHPGGVQPLRLPDPWAQRSAPLFMKVPGRWLTHVLTNESWKDPWVPVPLPEWLVG